MQEAWKKTEASLTNDEINLINHEIIREGKRGGIDEFTGENI